MKTILLKDGETVRFISKLGPSVQDPNDELPYLMQYRRVVVDAVNRDITSDGYNATFELVSIGRPLTVSNYVEKLLESSEN